MAYLNNKLACVTLLSSVIFSSQANATTRKDANSLEPPAGSFSAISIQERADTKDGLAILATNTKTVDNYGPWLSAEGFSTNTYELIQYMQDSLAHGLNPESYDLTEILNSISTVSKSTLVDQHDSQKVSIMATTKASQQANLENQLTQAFTKLANDLGKGATDAQKVQRQMFRAAPKVNTQEWIDAIYNGNITVSQALTSLMPQDQGYHRLTMHMRELLAERDLGIQRNVVEESAETAQEFAEHDIQSIKQRLVEIGNLPENTEINSEWDGNVEFALQAFQQHSGIPASGIADSRTRRALNLSLNEEIEAVAISLERWRWMPRVLGRKHVFINVPDYRVEVRKDEKTILSMKTVVGAVKHATPTFSEDLKYIVFNPTWTVPQSIANRDLIPKERRKPGYLKSRNFDIMQRNGDHLVKVSYDDVTEEDLNAKRFPYVLQQRSGNNNALGRMKFMMPNQWNIYMHDTQAKKLFSHDDRAYSSGCIRLSDPDSMARTLLYEDGYTEQEIDAALALTKRKLVRLRTPIPTHITYLTSWVDDDGVLNRRSDIYKHDDALIKALATHNTLLTILNQMPVISSMEGIMAPSGG